MLKVGFVGLGVMGKPMATNVLKKGFEVHAYDLSNDLVKEFESIGGIGENSIKEMVGKVDVVITMLPNSKIVESVMCGEDGIFKSAKKGTTIIDMSSVSAASTKKMACEAEKFDITYMDAPVSGGTAGAAAGTLTIMVGATEEAFNKVKPVFEAIGKNIYHIGPTGSGDTMKIVNNMLFACNMAALAEGLALGIKCGLSLSTMYEIIQKSSGCSYALTAKMEKFIMADNFNPGFAVDVHYKDIGLAIEQSRDEKCPIPVTSVTNSIYEMARAKGYGKMDISSLVKLYEEFENVKISGTK